MNNYFGECTILTLEVAVATLFIVALCYLKNLREDVFKKITNKPYDTHLINFVSIALAHIYAWAACMLGGPALVYDITATFVATFLSHALYQKIAETSYNLGIGLIVGLLADVGVAALLFYQLLPDQSLKQV
jgi:hypothetical protein